MSVKKFFGVIGNPPYQADKGEGDQENYAAPIYHTFMDEAFKVADKVELVTPARFLFNAGSTPKQWNRKMLNDEHLRVLVYEPDCSVMFPSTDIKGGIAITIHDDSKVYGAIGSFVVFEELRSIIDKIGGKPTESLTDIAFASESYKFTEKLYEDHPEIREMKTVYKGKEVPLMSKGHEYDFKTSVLEKLDDIVFFSERPSDGQDYVEISGLIKSKRVSRWILAKYVKGAPNFNTYKVFVPKANGSGALGEVLSTPLIGQPLIGHTQTFMSIGNFDSEQEARALMKYVKSKFARVLLGVLKITQDNPPDKWAFVPLQDFTSRSDIDWSQSVDEIDVQLFRKYRLDQKEINFIETNVKEMQ